MLISKNQLKAIIKEELVKTVIIREARAYQSAHGRIDEGLLTDLAKKYGLQKKAVAAILAASVAAGALAPTPAAAEILPSIGDEAALDIEIPQASDEPEARARKAYLDARGSGDASDVSSAIALALANLQNAGDTESVDLLKSMVTGDEETGYKFVGKEKPEDQSLDFTPTVRRTAAGDLPSYRE